MSEALAPAPPQTPIRRTGTQLALTILAAILAAGAFALVSLGRTGELAPGCRSPGRSWSLATWPGTS